MAKRGHRVTVTAGKLYRPKSFVWNNRVYEVSNIDRQWCIDSMYYSRVTCELGTVTLCYDASRQIWFLTNVSQCIGEKKSE